MMWDNYPEAVRLIRRGFHVVAGNKVYFAQGGQIGGRCNVGNPELHRGCQAMNAQNPGKHYVSIQKWRVYIGIPIGYPLKERMIILRQL